MTVIKPQTLPYIGQSLIDALIHCFESNSLMKIYPGRQFGLDIDPALEIVKPIINSVLGQNTWRVAGGNFFETETGYRVHADTGKEGPDNVWQTFVFPLRFTIKPGVTPNLERVRLLILHQSWRGDAAFFLRGSPDQPSEYNTVVKEYDEVLNKSSTGWTDAKLWELCPHLNPNNFVGLSIDRDFQWIPGVPITFPRDRLHVSSAFPRQGVAKKLGLSIFTSRL